jgi:phage tail sheath protein FI
MCAFQTTNRAPGVYIQEIDVQGPIPGVATSIAAFVGPSRNGPFGTPERLTSWTQFNDTFGDSQPESPYLVQPRFYVANAVEGFFANGGSTCWFVRASTAERASRAFQDGAGNDTLVVTAKEEGQAGNQITVAINDQPNIRTTQIVNENAPITQGLNDQVTLQSSADATKFSVGDRVEVDDAANPPETSIIEDVDNGIIVLETALANQFGAGTIRHADLVANQRRIRVENAGGIDPGSVIELNRGVAAGPTELCVVDAVESATGFLTLAPPGLANAYDLAAGDVPVDTREFALIIDGQTFDRLSMDPRHSRYFRTAVNSDLVEVTAPDPPNASPPPDDMPVVVNPAVPLQNGADDDLFALGGGEFKKAIDALRKVDEVSIVCVPDRWDQDVQQYLIEHCKNMQDRFAVLDPPRGLSTTEVQTHVRGNPVAQTTGLTAENGFAAIYYPWIKVSDPLGENGDRMLVPPSGHVAGLYGRVDSDRGVFKAPANEPLARALDLERRLEEADIGLLNEQGINVIRTLQTQWRYVNVRRLLLFIEESIQEATEFALFEPNEPTLWETIKRQVTGFLTPLWAAGALFGATPEDAFSVRVDEELNPPALRSLGLLVVEVVVCPTTPAEFIVFRVIQRPNGPVVEE